MSNNTKNTNDVEKEFIDRTVVIMGCVSFVFLALSVAFCIRMIRRESISQATVISHMNIPVK